jgi:hypothetical protein
VTGEPPWEDYSRGRLRSGMSYPVGRDFVERCLRDAAVVIGSLSFVGGTADPRHAPERRLLVDLYWFGDARSAYRSDPRRTRASYLFMRLWAVPAEQRKDAGQLLAEGLPVACRWAAAAKTRGTAWSASQHVLTLWHAKKRLEIEET